MRSFLFVLLLATAPVSSAQGLFLPEGSGGFSLGVATSLNDGVGDASLGITATPSPAFDISGSVSRSPLESDGLTAYGVGTTVYLDNEGPARAGVLVGITRVMGEQFDTGHILSGGARAGRPMDLGDGFRMVPNVSISVSLLMGGDLAGGGIQTSAAVDVPFIVGDASGIYIAPSLSLNSEQAGYARGLDSFGVGLRAGILFGEASAGR